LVTIAMPLRPAIDLIWHCSRMKASIFSIERGRPAHDWRAEFEENLAEVAESLRATEPTRPSIQEDIAAYRRERAQVPREARVAVPT
jgi:hypothetical protein